MTLAVIFFFSCFDWNKILYVELIRIILRFMFSSVAINGIRGNTYTIESEEQNDSFKFWT